jgi:predicted nuclease of predicted toxin-antitoxin system
MDLLIDMNLTPRWLGFLAEAGHRAVHWTTMGNPTASDKVIFDYARRNGFVVLTNDLDFPQILAYTRDSQPSVVLLRGEPLIPEARGEAVLKALRECAVELSKGAILSLDLSGRARSRLLPLGEF